MRKVARGSDVDIVVRADTSMPRVPKVVEIRYREEGGVQRPRRDEPRWAWPIHPRIGTRSSLYTRRNVLSPIRFDVYGGDYCISDQRIEVVDNPTVALTLDCEFPAYINRPAAKPAGGRRDAAAAGLARNRPRTRRIKNWCACRSIRPPMKIAASPPRYNREQRSYRPTAVDSITRWNRWIKIQRCLFTLFDGDGIKSREPMRLGLAAVADQAPQVAAQLDGIGTAITPQARVGVAGRVTDDYGIGRVWFEHAVDRTNTETTTMDAPDGHPTEYKLDPRDAALEVRDLKLKPGQKLFLTRQGSRSVQFGKRPQHRRRANAGCWTLSLPINCKDAQGPRTGAAAAIRGDNSRNH